MNVKTLKAAAIQAAKLVNVRHPMPLLRCVRLDASAGRLRLTATDCDTWLQTDIDMSGDMSASFSTAVDAKAFAAAVKTAAGDASISLIDANTLQIGGVRLPTLDPADYPAMPQIDDNATSQVISADLPAALEATTWAVSNEGTRYYLNGIHIRTTASGVDMVATDGHKLARYALSNDASAESAVNCIIPRAALPFLSDATGVGITSDFAVATIGATRVVCRLIDGSFPDYTRVIPSKQSNTRNTVVNASCNVSSLSAAANTAISLHGGKRKETVQTVWQGDTLTLKGETTAVLPLSGASAPGTLQIGFDARLITPIAAAFKAAGQTSATAYATDAGSPVLWESGRLQIVVMPLRV